mgnify:FL=1
MKKSPFLIKNSFLKNSAGFVIKDNFPVSKGHSLVVPIKKVKSIFDLKKNEYLKLFELVMKTKNYLKKKYSPKGFNIGINDGKVAGQTVKHAHIHVIPRYRGDHKDPRGGIRAVIPGKKNYL